MSEVVTMEKSYKAAVDIGGTKVTASLSDKGGILVKVYQPTKLTGDNKTIPRQIDSLVESACQKIKIKKDRIDAMGVSTCSPFEKRRGYLVVVAPNLCGGLARQRGVLPNDWTEIPLEKELSKTYQGLRIGNDCVTAVVAERLFGAGRGAKNLIYVTWSTGIGTGAYATGIDQETGQEREFLLSGKNRNAPHGGHIYIAEHGPQCGCGNYGDLESLTSGPAISREYGNVTREVFQACRRGDDLKAKKVIERAARNFARGMASVNSVLDTEVIVIGGSVFMNNLEILLPLIKEEFYRSFPTLSRGVEIRPSELESYLGDIAALSLVMPGDWVEEWQHKKPWTYAPEPIVVED